MIVLQIFAILFPALAFANPEPALILKIPSLNEILTQEQAQTIGRQIWKNECGGTQEGLTSWNKGEEFPSLGIGHFIWYPKDYSGPYKETFPEFIQFLKNHSVEIPEWLHQSAPWASQSEFLQALNSKEMISLRTLLSQTIDLQLLFILERTEHALNNLPNEKQKVRLLLRSPEGTYAIIDYINFKGEGTSSQERYQNQGWGLLQVLQAMPSNLTEKQAVNAFVEAAKQVLKQRVENSPPERGEERWLKGWSNRLNTYYTK